jgi:hypothetical protein
MALLYSVYHYGLEGGHGSVAPRLLLSSLRRAVRLHRCEGGTMTFVPA